MWPVLEVANLQVTFGDSVAAVRGASLTVNRGETHCLVGESGCGKSVTALAVMNLPARGTERRADVPRFHDTDLRRLSERGMARLRGNKVAMVFQEPMTSLNPAYTIGSQMAEVLQRHRRASRVQALDRAAELLGRVGITAPDIRLKQYPHQLSGGLRQRVMIAMALMCEPELLIADEPTTALDVTVQTQILRLLQTLQRELGLALLLITYDLGIVARMAQHVSVMYAGEVVESAPVEELFAAPTHPYTRGLLACIPVPGGLAARCTARQHSRRGAAHRAQLRRLCVPRPLRTRDAGVRRTNRLPLCRRGQGEGFGAARCTLLVLSPTTRETGPPLSLPIAARLAMC